MHIPYLLDHLPHNIDIEQLILVSSIAKTREVDYQDVILPQLGRDIGVNCCRIIVVANVGTEELRLRTHHEHAYFIIVPSLQFLPK